MSFETTLISVLSKDLESDGDKELTRSSLLNLLKRANSQHKIQLVKQLEIDIIKESTFEQPIYNQDI